MFSTFLDSQRRNHKEKTGLNVFFQTFVLFLVVFLWLLVTAPLYTGYSDV